MNQQPHKPEMDPRKDGTIDPVKPNTSPGSNPNDPSRRNVSPTTDRPDRDNRDRQSEPDRTQEKPPNLQSHESERHPKRGEFQFQKNRYTSRIE